MLLFSYRKTLSVPVFFVTLLACAGCSAGQPEAPPLPALAKPAPFTAADSAFIQKLSDTNLTLVALGNAAQTQAGRSDLAQLGTTMSKDLTASQAQLTTLATAHTLTLPDKPSATYQAQIASAQKRRGVAFDRYYTATFQKIYTLMKPALSTEIASSKNTDLVKLATDTQSKLNAYKTQM